MATTNSNTAGSTEPGSRHIAEPLTARTVNANASTAYKRKLTDLELEIITIDQSYDLTLIMGSQDYVDGQKAFQISRGSMRRIGDVRCKQSEIEMPDDSCKTTLLVLRIAYLNGCPSHSDPRYGVAASI